MGQDFTALVADGYTSFKVYMTYDDVKLTDREMLDALAAARREQAMLMIHAENSDCIAWLTERLEWKGMTAAKFHATSRPFVVEREATHRAISLAELLDVPMLLVHVSAKEAMHEIQRAQARGLKVYGETCPQYLFLSEEDFDKPGDEGSKCVCSPPPRGTENQEHIWTGPSAPTPSMCCRPTMPPSSTTTRAARSCPAPTRASARSPTACRASRPACRCCSPRASTRAASPCSSSWRCPRPTPPRSTACIRARARSRSAPTPTSCCGIPTRKVSLTNSILHHNCDYTPYEGRELTGYPVMTLSRGEVVMEEARMSGSAGRGLFQKCDRPEAARPRGKPLIDPSIFS